MIGSSACDYYLMFVSNDCFHTVWSPECCISYAVLAISSSGITAVSIGSAEIGILFVVLSVLLEDPVQ